MTGHYLRATTSGHHCEPPGGLSGLALDIYRTPYVGTLWECECGRLYQVRTNARPPGYAVRRGWVRVGWVATLYWRWRYRNGAATIEHGEPPTGWAEPPPPPPPRTLQAPKDRQN